MAELVNQLLNIQRPVRQQRGLGDAQKQQQIANMLLSSGAKTNNPIIAALTGFFGAQAGISASEQFGALEQQQMAQQQARLDRQETRADTGLEMQQKQFEESKKQFQQSLSLKRDQFNSKAILDAKKNIITKVKDAKSGNDLLFKGVVPITDGLEKGMQWAMDDKGNRLAVAIPTAPNEKAKQTADLTKEIVGRLLNNADGVRDNFGLFDSMAISPNIQEETRSAATDIKQLKSLLTVENLDLMSGVLSETDIKILAAVSGGQFDEDATEEGVVRALNKMYKSLGGDPTTTALGGKQRGGTISQTATAGDFQFEGFE